MRMRMWMMPMKVGRRLRGSCDNPTGPMDQWTTGPMGTWAHGHMGHMGTWAHGASPHGTWARAQSPGTKEVLSQMFFVYLDIPRRAVPPFSTPIHSQGGRTWAWWSHWRWGYLGGAGLYCHKTWLLSQSGRATRSKTSQQKTSRSRTSDRRPDENAGSL